MHASSRYVIRTPSAVVVIAYSIAKRDVFIQALYTSITNRSSTGTRSAKVRSIRRRTGIFIPRDSTGAVAVGQALRTGVWWAGISPRQRADFWEFLSEVF